MTAKRKSICIFTTTNAKGKMKKIKIELSILEAKTIVRLLVIAMNLAHICAGQITMNDMLHNLKTRIEEELLKE